MGLKNIVDKAEILLKTAKLTEYFITKHGTWMPGCSRFTTR